MNARTLPFGQLLQAAHDFHGLKLDLYGTLTEDGYQVNHACLPGTPIDIAAAMSPDLIAALGAALDDALPTAEQLRRESEGEARLERARYDYDMRMYGWGGMA